MAALVNADKAIIDERKLCDYVLDTDNPVDGHEARVIFVVTGLG